MKTYTVCPECSSINHVDLEQAREKPPVCGVCKAKLELQGLEKKYLSLVLERFHPSKVIEMKAPKREGEFDPVALELLVVTDQIPSRLKARKFSMDLGGLIGKPAHVVFYEPAEFESSKGTMGRTPYVAEKYGEVVYESLPNPPPPALPKDAQEG